METKIYDNSINARAIIVLEKNLEWLMDNGATKIDGEFHFRIDEVPTATIKADLILIDRSKL